MHIYLVYKAQILNPFKAQILNPFNYRALQSYQKLPGSMANHVFLFFFVLQEAFEESIRIKHAFHD